MKNLSLQMTDTASIKKPADVVNRSNTSADSAVSAESNASFQMIFNKQVQAKHASSQDAQSKQVQAQNNIAKQAAAKVSGSSTKSEAIDAGIAQQNVQKASHLQLAMTATKHTKTIKNAESTDATQAETKDSAELDAKTKSLKKNVEDNKSEDGATTVADVNFTSVTNAILPSAILENKQVSPSTSNPNTESAAANETLSEKQRSLSAEIRDTVLNNAFSQGKNSNSSEVQSVAEGDDKRAQNNWVDAMLPNASAKPMNSDDAAKLMLNAEKEGAGKEHAIKESEIKEVAVPANFQSTTQINTTEAMKQVSGSNTINAYPGKTGWDQAISQKVVWMLGAQEQSATLTLNPPELGPLQVVIHVHNDQADTTFISDNAEVRQALQDGMDNLRNKLNESGIQLGQANVNSGGQMQQQFQQASQQKGLGSQQIVNSSAAPIENRHDSQRINHLVNGLVDTFA